MRKIIITIFVFILLIASAFFSIRFLIDYKNDKTTANGEPSELISLDLEKDNEYYTIKYNLDDGIIQDNPTKYNLFTETFTLNNPIKEGYDFIGWTGTDLNEPKLQVTICKGSSGDLEFTANYKLILNAPTISKQGSIISWPAVDNAVSYTINLNGYTCKTNNLSFDLTEIKDYIIEGKNIVKVRADSKTSISSQYSNVITFNTDILSVPIAKVEGTIFSWQSVANAESYTFSIGGFTETTSETSINLLNYSDYLSSTGHTFVKVKANAKSDDVSSIGSVYCENIEFLSILGEVSLTIDNNILRWTSIDYALYYEIYLNGNLVQKIYEATAFDILILESKLNSTNTVYIKACRNGFVSSQSNLVNYTYFNVAELDNLQIEGEFTRNSDYCTLDATNYVYKNSSKYKVNSNYLKTRFEIGTSGYGGWNIVDKETDNLVSHNLFNTDWNLMFLAFSVEFDFSTYRLTFNDSNQSLQNNSVNMGKLLLYINSCYVPGVDTQIIDLSGMFKFVNLTSNAEYIPNHFSIKVHYGEMFSSVSFSENCDYSLDEFESYDMCYIQYVLVLRYKLQSIDVNLKDINGTIITIPPKLEEEGLNYTAKLNEYKSYKFKLDDNHYFMIKDILSLVDALGVDSKAKVDEKAYLSSWQGHSYEKFDITNYIDVYTNDGTHIDYNYTLRLTYVLSASLG